MTEQIEKTPILIEDHKNNEFRCQGDGENIPVRITIRSKEGYPAPNECNCFLGISKDKQPLYLIQKYDRPVGNRPADTMTAFRIFKRGNEYDLKLFRQLCSDLFFETTSAESVSYPSSLTVNTWALFTEALRLDRCHCPYNFYHKIGQKAKGSIDPSCENLDYPGFCRAVRIFSGTSNSTANKKAAIRLATLNFDAPETITDSTADIRNALSTLERCEYKTKGYLFLLTQRQANDKDITNYLGTSADTDESMFNLYIRALRSEDENYLEMLRPMVRQPAAPEAMLTAKEAVCGMIVRNKPVSDVVRFNLLYMCSLIDDPRCQEYLRSFFAQIRSDQLFRHDTLEAIYNKNSKFNLSGIFRQLGGKAYREEAALLSGDPDNCGYYVHDLFYLGFISNKDYGKHKGSDSIKYLCDFALADFELAESNERCERRVEDFFGNLSGSTKRRVRKEFKGKVIGPINTKLKEAFAAVGSNLMNRIKTAIRIRQFI
ncbi:MAG: hypothetical protein Q4A05_09025 [Ruminococcus sp.]|nr:hypothetical protein [Ruminococcus sp.]